MDQNSRHIFGTLKAEAPDALLALIKAYRDDPRPTKIDLGVGVYRDAAGGTPVFRSMKAAEKILLETQDSKSYLGPEGDMAFVQGLRPWIFGAGLADDARIVGVQTPGGTGAVRLAADLLARTGRDRKVFLGTPTWPNHPPLVHAAGLAVETYGYYDAATQTVRFDAMMQALVTARAGDVALLHGCCHNPTGEDLTRDQWLAVAELLSRNGVIPLVDLAYQGLGHGMAEDAAGLHIILDHCPEVLIAYSCDKNFGVYRERVGALYVRAADAATAEVVNSNMLSIARATWSMPPDHGAAAVRIILQDAALTADWQAELDSMRDRVRQVRDLLTAKGGILAPVARQNGLFSMLPLSPDQVKRLRAEHGVYMAGSGRINVAGLTADNVPVFAAAVQSVL